MCCVALGWWVGLRCVGLSCISLRRMRAPDSISRRTHSMPGHRVSYNRHIARLQ